jgi:putative endonuclease
MAAVPACRQAGSRKQMWYVYILKSIKFQRYYIGLSDDVDRRFLEHNNGWVKKTKFYKPFRLAHVEITDNRQEARQLEKYFKSGYGKEIIKEIDGNSAPR